MQLFAGLGNPGEKYRRNRHNIGFMAADAIHYRHRFSPWRKRFQAQTAEGEIAGEKILLVKPETYMNDSGIAVSAAQNFFKVALGDIVVLYDEIDLPPAKLRVKTGGGNAGHNGLRSITAHCGNDYQRVRIGVGHPGDKALVARHVLSDFAKSEQPWVEAMCEAISDAAQLLVARQQVEFQTRIHLTMEKSNTIPTGAPRP
ncbi:MAG: aminoacyl-tRNA hydrolase [Xanthobacteraceae bacterium]|nr:aminoacyl-tRNA hydrolase [Xanthobacteraceae bacterium]QYK44439.1 MAG: aminoacyl-tRNA hydrolase [Xanthobacteraceae bacterium]HMN51102.1 aminoacyl-tRNA hydrolase [Xanthobacteraceae bacterium]